jgi:ankyrin repeat protein
MRASLVALAFALLGAGSALADTPLTDAVRDGDRAAALALIQTGADVNARDNEGATALIWAAHNEDPDLAARLIAAGANVGLANDYGATAMSEAAATGNAAIIGQLLKAGADVESANREGQTALMAVARTGKVEAAKLLLDKGAKVNAVEQWGQQSALMWAAAQSQPEMIALLISRGADVNARGAVRDWQRRITAEPRPKDMYRGGFTPLLYAAREGCIECAKLLVKGGAKINIADPDGVTPLVMALLSFHFEFAQYLIASGADVDKWDLYGRSPLYAAIDMNVLPEGGRPDVPSEDTITGLDVARQLLKAGANPNLQLKLRPPYRNVIYDRGGDNVLSTGATSLLHAAKVGDAKAVALLIEYKALVDLPTSTGVTPVMAAAGMGQGANPTRGRFKTDEEGAACMRLLLAAGADPNLRGPQGQTALHVAAQRGANPVVAALAEFGADLEAKDAGGKTPLDYASGNLPASRGGPPPAHAETVALLKSLIAAKPAAKP